MFEDDVPPPLDVHDAVYRALNTLTEASAQVAAIQRRAVRKEPLEPLDLVGALEAIRASLERLRGQLHLVDEAAGGAGDDVVLEVRPERQAHETRAVRSANDGSGSAS